MEIPSTILVVIAIVSVMGLIGIVAMDVVNLDQFAEAKGCNNEIALNASQGRCVMGWRLSPHFLFYKFPYDVNIFLS